MPTRNTPLPAFIYRSRESAIFCDRKYDCVNESRPGVTSSVLSPYQALDYLKRMVAREPRIAVMGIAGPGDPFANPDETMETLRLVRAAFPKMLLWLLRK